MPYQSTSEKSLESNQIAIAICRGLLGAHLGVAFWDDEDKPALLHLAFHRNLIVDPYPPTEPWAISYVELGPLSVDVARSMLSGVAALYSGGYRDDGIDYGLNLFAGVNSIRPDGKYVPTNDCDGYTCSSLIAAIFEKIGFPLVDLSTWQEQSINMAWGRAIVCLLRATNASNDHIAHVEKNIKGLRLRPEEVAAAGEIKQTCRPAKYSDIQRRADEIFGEMLAVCGSPDPGRDSPIQRCVDAFDNQRKLLGMQRITHCLRAIAKQKEVDVYEIPSFLNVSEMA